jgi:hypothetical protein
MSVASYEWEAMPVLGPAHEWEEEYELEATLGGLGGGALLREAAWDAARAVLGLAELEGELEGEEELNPVRKVYPDAALEHLAHAAMNAESEAEAGEAFLPLIPMVAAKVLPLAARALPHVARALPRVVSAVSRVTPQLTRGVARIAGRLYRNPTTRRLLRTLPTIARRTIGNLAHRAARGQPLTPRTALRTLAGQTASVLSSRPRVAGALRRSRVMDRVYHRAVAPGLVSPTAAPRLVSPAVAPGVVSPVVAPGVISPVVSPAPIGTRPAWVGPPAASGRPCPCAASAGVPSYVPPVQIAAQPLVQPQFQPAPIMSAPIQGQGMCRCPCPYCGR